MMNLVKAVGPNKEITIEMNCRKFRIYFPTRGSKPSNLRYVKCSHEGGTYYYIGALFADGSQSFTSAERYTDNDGKASGHAKCFLRLWRNARRDADPLPAELAFEYISPIADDLKDEDGITTSAIEEVNAETARFEKIQAEFPGWPAGDLRDAISRVSPMPSREGKAIQQRYQELVKNDEANAELDQMIAAKKAAEAASVEASKRERAKEEQVKEAGEVEALKTAKPMFDFDAGMAVLSKL